MINRIIQKVKFLLLQSSIGSFDQARKTKTFVAPDSKTIEQSKELLRPIYELYVKEVSRADMAASLELVAFMHAACKANKYTKLLDLGSGLSSFVFRLYAMENPDVIVFSVDDDAAWLEKTKDFLSKKQLSTENFFTLDQFLKSNETEFDCILHDLNFVEVRIDYIEHIMKIAKKNGLIILDDIHKPDYLHSALIKLQKIKVKKYDLKPVTFDGYGRFSLAVIKEE